MKKLFKTTILTTAAALSAVVYMSDSRLSFADEASSEPEISSNPKVAFTLGICVAKRLTAQGVTLPSLAEVKAVGLNTATKDAMRKALQECSDELKKWGESSGSPEGSS
jgi:hypothetical protein